MIGRTVTRLIGIFFIGDDQANGAGSILDAFFLASSVLIATRDSCTGQHCRLATVARDGNRLAQSHILIASDVALKLSSRNLNHSLPVTLLHALHAS